MMKTFDSRTHALLAAPLGAERGTESLGRALWLYVAFLLAANDQGLVIRKSPELARDLSVPESTIATWLMRLANAKLVEVLSPVPYLTVRFPVWSGNTASVEENAVLSAEERENGNSKQGSEAISISRSAGDGGQGEGDLGFALRAILPEAEDAEIDRILDRYPREMVRRAVDRVAKAGRIRKSKAALFRYLLAKFSESIDVRDL